MKNGLTHNDVWSITQDRFGYIWLGTKKGLNRFDGTNIQQFFSDTSQKSLPADWAHQVQRINNEELGVATMGGLHIINTKTLAQRNIVIPADSLKDISRVNRVFDFASDQKGNIFLITTTGFYHYNNDKLVFRHDHFSRKFLETKGGQFGWRVALMNDHELILSTLEGLYVYNISKKDLHPLGGNDDPFYNQIASPRERFFLIYNDASSFGVVLPEKNELAFFDLRSKTKMLINVPANISKSFNLTVAMLPVNDTLMLITDGRLGFYKIRLDQQTRTWSVDPKRYLENEYCSALILDKNKRLWVGTTQGAYIQKRSGGSIEQFELPPGGHPLGKAVMSLTVADNKIFAGSALEGLYVFERDSIKLLEHFTWPETRMNHITSIVSINNDSLLMSNGGVVVDTRKLVMKQVDLTSDKTLNKGMGCLFRNSRGQIYIVKSTNDTLFVKGPANKYFSPIKIPELQKIRSVREMVEDPQGNIWFGGDGLIRWNYRSGKTDLFLDSFPAFKIPNKTITGNIVFDRKGRVYFGVDESGVVIYDMGTKKFSHITRLDGLPDNLIKDLYLYEDEILWIATDNGLASYDLQSHKVSALGVADGIPTDPNACLLLYYDSAHRQMYASFTHRIVRFDPGQLKKNQSPPDFFVESIVVNGKNSFYHPDGDFSVSYKNNNIALTLAAINFEDASQQQFAYRFLVNGNESWQEIGNQKRIFLSSLPVGKHRLQLKAYIRNQNWPDQVREIMVTVRPPFWNTIWFYLAISLLAGALLVYLHRRRINHITQKANIDRQLSEMEMKGLHAQMNPHFIFNCLNSIREMILNDENKEASHYLSKFAQLIRITLDQSTRSFVSLKNTIDYLERYLEMEKIRNSLFTYTIKIDEQLQPDEIMIPPMLIQPFLENSIWHGATPGKELDIIVHFTKDENKLVCTIEDNGVGIETSMRKKSKVQIDHNPIGIANVKERIQVLNEKYNLHSKITIDDKSSLNGGDETGTRVKLFLQLNSVAL